jgi:hypothetical protein
VDQVGVHGSIGIEIRLLGVEAGARLLSHVALYAGFFAVDHHDLVKLLEVLRRPGKVIEWE